MKKSRIISLVLGVVMIFSLALVHLGTAAVYADGIRVVTIGADLSEQQRASIFRFFGTSEDQVTVLTITNADERAHLEHLFPSDVIGWQTFSCAYVCPTESNGIQVKTANMNYVTGDMIAATLSTSGVVNCDVLAAAPFEVSGTGALTGVIMAYETAIGEELDPEKKELANEELVTTGEIAEEVGQDEAILIVNDIKIRIIRDGASAEDVEDIVNDVLGSVMNAAAMSGKSMSLSQESYEMLYEFGKKVADMGYNFDDMSATLQRVAQNVTESTQIDDPIMDTFENKVSDKIAEDSILNNSDDSALGDASAISTTYQDPSEQEEVSFEGSFSADGVSLTERGAVNSNAWVSDTNLLRYSANGGDGLMDADGNTLTAADYAGLYGEYGFITGALPNGEINAHGMLNTAGEEIIPFKYGNVDVENKYWAVCWVVEESTEDDADARDYMNDTYYRIVTADVYALDKDQATLVKTLTRDDIGEYYAYGKCINIEQRSTGTVNTYDSSFNVVAEDVRSVYSEPEDVNTGEIRTFRKNGQDGLLDAEGNVLMNPSYYYVYADSGRDCILVSTGDKEGLIDWNGNELIPPVYDSMESNSYVPLGDHMRSAYGYLGNGYALAENDGHLVFVDVNGNETYTASETRDEVYEDGYLCGASFIYEPSEGTYEIVSADGVVTTLTGYTRVSPLYYGSGMLYKVQSEDYSYGLIDWHGNVIFDPKFDRIELSADGTHLLVNEYSAGSCVFDVTYEGPVFVPKEKAEPETAKEPEVVYDIPAGDLVSLSEYTTYDESVSWIYDTSVLTKYRPSQVFDIDGQALSADAYDGFSGYGDEYIVVTADDDKAGEGLLSVSGELLIPAEYDVLELRNRYWAVGVHLEPTDADEGDYKDYSNDSYLNIVTADIYRLDNGTAKLCATLDYDAIADYYSDQSYINIQDRAGNVTSYDAAFNVIGTGLSSVYSEPEGVTHAYSTFRENGQYGVMDENGNVVMPASYYYIYINDSRGYFEISDGDYTGAADLQGQVIVPVEYDRVLTSYYQPVTPDRPGSTGLVSNGYVPVEKDELVGFCDINGQETVAPCIDKETADVNGATIKYTDADGHVHILAGDGTDTVLSDEYTSVYPLNYGAGMLYRVNNADYDYGLIDWHGNVLLPLEYTGLNLSADGQYLLAGHGGGKYTLYHVSYNGEEAEAGKPAVAEQETKAPAEPEPATEEVTEAPEPATEEVTEAAEPESQEAPASEDQAMVAQILQVIQTAAAEDFEGNKDKIVLLLQQVSPMLAEEYPDAANLLDSAVQLIEAGLADADALGILTDAALEQMGD